MNPTNPKELVVELIETYDLGESNVSVKPNGEIVFDLEGLQIMTSKLCTDLVNDELAIRPFHEDQKYFYCDSILTLKGGRTVKRSGVAMIGEQLGDEIISNFQQAQSIAAGRAYRNGLRAIAFDPIRAHRLKTSGFTLIAETEDEARITLRKELHALAHDLGYIVGANNDKYRELLRVMYNGRTSSTELNDEEIQQLVLFLRASKRARQRAEQLKQEAELKAA